MAFIENGYLAEIYRYLKTVIYKKGLMTGQFDALFSSAKTNLKTNISSYYIFLNFYFSTRNFMYLKILEMMLKYPFKDIHSATIVIKFFCGCVGINF